jgi:hypothetical protein
MENQQIDPEELSWVMYLYLNSNIRIYDALLTLIAGLVGSEQAKNLQQLHEKGSFLYPPPYLQQQENDPQ